MRGRRVIGLTGGIGAGKSVVSRILRLQGYTVYDCDTEAKRLMADSELILESLRGKFGDNCILPDGTINRSHLSECVFGDRKSLDWLNGLVHTAVRNDIAEWIGNKDGVCFIESAIIHTSHIDRICDEVWLVDAPEGVRLNRACARGGIERENIMRRMEAQRKEFDEIENENIKVIRNYGDYSLLEQIEEYKK